MSADVAGLLASIDDVLAAPSAVSAPVAEPVEEREEPRRTVTEVARTQVGPTVAERLAGRDRASVEQRERMDASIAAQARRLDEQVEREERLRKQSASGPTVSTAPRLPYWWQQKAAEQPADTADTAADTAVSGQPEAACGHETLLLLRPERSDEVVGRLCLDCDTGLPAADPEPKAECEHAERLEARSESGTLVGYVCAAEGCRVRLTKDQVHGRIGKWLRPAQSYYPRLRNPLSPAEGDASRRPALSAATRRLLANAGAAGAGYVLGLTPMVGAWIEECGRTTSIGGALFLGGSLCLALGHFWDRRTRHWYPGLAWVARIPLASAITALALYAPASQI